jgi:putative intracellular protease/amidase
MIMKKVLIVETNVSRYHGTSEPTGLWLGEATEFVDEMRKSKIAVDYVSPNGGFVPLDPRSMKYTDESIMAIYESQDFIERGLISTLRPTEINSEDYFAIYNQGGYITSVCHGIAEH